MILHKNVEPGSTCGGQVASGRDLFNTDHWCVYCGHKWSDVTTETVTEITLPPFSVVVSPGKVPINSWEDNPSQFMRVFIRIQFDGRRLSMTGVEGPKSNGNAAGGAGQIDMHMDDDYLSTMVFDEPGWDRTQFERLIEIWGLWHLNDMRAGTPSQTAHLRAHRVKVTYRKSQYEQDLKTLASAGLQPDPETGYSYGSQWLYEPLPADVHEYLSTLVPTTRTYAWV